jgi:hypothetical protein
VRCVAQSIHVEIDVGSSDKNLEIVFGVHTTVELLTPPAL